MLPHLFVDALETRATRTRLVDGRRLSGERPVVVARSGRRWCGSHRNRRFLRRVRSNWYPNSERSLKQVQARSDEELSRKGGPGGSVANTSPGLRQSPVQRGSQGDMRSYHGHRDREAGPPPDRRARQIGPHYLTLGLYVTANSRHCDCSINESPVNSRTG